MQNFNKLAILAVIINLGFTSVMAAEVTSGAVLNQVSGKYGADLRDVTGATVNTNGTFADITNTQTNSVLNWNTLNTAAGQTLNFNMAKGETALNKVVGVAPSTFAGNLTSTGGRVIIANPNGMIFENGSYTNVNSLVLTTHDISINENDIQLKTNYTNGTIIIGAGDPSKVVVMEVARDLQIISDNININNADIIAPKVNLVTTDGITYVASGQNWNVTNNSALCEDKNLMDNGSVKIEETTFDLVRNTAKGTLTIVARGNIEITNSNIKGDFKATAAKKAALKDANYETVVSSTTTEYKIGIDGNPSELTEEQLAAAYGKVYETVTVNKEEVITTGKLYQGRGDVIVSNSHANSVSQIKANYIEYNEDFSANISGLSIEFADPMKNFKESNITKITTDRVVSINDILESLTPTPTPTTPTEEDIVATEDSTEVATDNNDNNTIAFNYDNDRRKYGEEVDTIMRRQFTPRGFAASDDEIQSRIASVVSSARKGKNANSIILSKQFLTDVDD